MKTDDELLAIILDMATVFAHDVVEEPKDYFRDDNRLTDKEYVRVVDLCKGITFTVTMNEVDP